MLTKVDNKEDVDAILSDIFKTIYEKAKHTMYYTNSVGHIYKIAKRKVFDYYKTKGLEFKTTDNDASEFELDVVMNLVLASCTKTQVKIIKSRSNGMSDEEIAEELEMSVELVKDEIAVFSKQLNLKELYSYISDVKKSTEKILKDLSFEESKINIPAEKKDYLKSLKVVSEDEEAVWLIDYWCDKDIRGLIQMPFSRHWIMHTEACLRIKDKITK